MWESWVQSLDWEDPLEKEITTHSNTPAWRTPWTEEPGGLHSPRGHKEPDMTEWLRLSLFPSQKRAHTAGGHCRVSSVPAAIKFRDSVATN